MNAASDAILDALEQEQRKLERQLANVARTKAVMEVLGDSVKERNKLARQERAIKETKANISKLNAAIK